MKTFKKKVLISALAGASVLGLAGTAQAVNVNPDGLGQVLIYPYYTVRENIAGASFDSLFSVVNSTDNGKAVKVRFLEGKNSREVLDFNLYMSPHDVWTAAISADADGANLVTTDTSCTRPVDLNSLGKFRNYEYADANADFEDATLDRTREGYVEVIEMAEIAPAHATALLFTHGSATWNCGAPELLNVGAGWSAPAGGLFGSMTLVSPKGGLDVAYDPVALEDFYSIPSITEPGSLFPNLNNAEPRSTVVDGQMTYFTDWTGAGANGAAASLDGATAVSAVLMHDSVINEYVKKGGAGANTDWVVTMPTKSFFYDRTAKTATAIPMITLFQRDFVKGGACDDISFVYYDREELGAAAGTEDVSPRPPAGAAVGMCWEANVLAFDKPILGSKNSLAIALPETHLAGWGNLKFTAGTAGSGLHELFTTVASTTTFDAATQTASAAPVNVTFSGLPTVGFAVQVFNNGALDGANGKKVNANYAGRLNHKLTRNIVTAP